MFSPRQQFNPMTEAKKHGAMLRKKDVMQQLMAAAGEYGTDVGEHVESSQTANVFGNVGSALLMNYLIPGSGVMDKILKASGGGGLGTIFGDLLQNLFGKKKPKKIDPKAYTSKLTGPYMSGTSESIHDYLAEIDKQADPVLSGMGGDNLLTSLMMSGYSQFGPDIRELLGLYKGGGSGIDFWQGNPIT